MLMKGKDGIQMHDHPFRLLRVTCVDDNGNPVYTRPMWLLVFGKRRNELSLTACVDSFLQRYDIEHFFRFGKQKLLLTAAQSLFAVALLINLKLSRSDGILLVVLFAAQLIVEQIRMEVAAIYIGLAIAYFVVHRKSIIPAVRTGLNIGKQ